MFTEICAVAPDGITAVFGVVALLWIFGKIYLGFSAIYYFSMYWIYSLKQDVLSSTFGGYAPIGFAIFAVILLMLFRTIGRQFPDHR